MTQASQDQTMMAARYLLFFAGSWLASHNYIKSADVNDLVSAIMIIAPLVWAWIDNQMKARRVAIGVQSGINLVVSGRALDARGNVIAGTGNGTTPPLPVTISSAAQIVKDFAPATAPGK